ncbi:MAG: signal recognition particle receptor subunit alpha, partial [Clostridia bacterium]|nr:signal recognition particle receptor subunit alpha [Clostridia bacterium]
MAFDGLSEKLNGIFKKLRSRGRLTESDVKEAMREVRMALLEADVNFKVAKEFVANVTEKAIGSNILESLTPAQQVIKIVNDELCQLMGGTQSRIRMASSGPTVIMFVGLQGAGKTTNIAKLGAHFKKTESRRPLLCACDVYRPAAIEQLKVLGRQLDIPVFEQGKGDPVEIAKAAYEHA